MSPLPHLNPRIGFVGTKDASPKVSFSGAVAMEYFGTGEFGECTYVACDDFIGVYKALHTREIDYFVLPTFNKIQGSVKENSLFLTMTGQEFPAEYEQTVQPVYFHGMAKKYVKFSLMGLPGATTEDATDYVTIEPAKNQCGINLEPLELNFKPIGNTGLAAEYVAKQKNKKILAIASHEAAKEYGLVELNDDFADKIDGEPNHTLFMIGSLEPPQISDEDENPKQVLYVGLKNEPQNLYKILKLIGERGINVPHITSLYDKENNLDQIRCELETNLASDQMQQLIRDLIELKQPFHIMEDMHNDEYYIPADQADNDDKFLMEFDVSNEPNNLTIALGTINANISHIDSFYDNKRQMTKIRCRFDANTNITSLYKSKEDLIDQNRKVKLAQYL